MPTAQLKRYYSVKESSKLLGVSTNTIYTYLDTGKIKARRIGRGRFKIPFKELAPFVDFDNLNDKAALSESEVKLAESPFQKVEVLKTPEVVVETTHNISKTPENNSELVASVGVVENKVKANVIEETNILIPSQESGTEIVAGANDKIIWRIFKALALIGFGAVYIFTTKNTYNFSGMLLQESGEVLRFIMPYALIAGGLFTLLDCFYEKRLRQYDVLIHIFNSFVLSYFSVMSLLTGEYGSFVFASSLAILVISHLIRGVNHIGSFYQSFTKYTVLVSIIGGAVILINPSFFPLPYLHEFISSHKGIFAVTWFSLLTLPPIFMLSQAGRNSRSFISFFYFVTGIMTLIYATQLSIQEKWDIAYISYLMVVFGLFLSWWNYKHSTLLEKRLTSLSASFVWVSVAILLGLFIVSGVTSNLKKEKEALTLSALEESKKGFENVLDKSHSLLIGYSGSSEVVSLFELGEEENSVQKAKEIFEKSEFARRVILVNKEGRAIGVYPREPAFQSADLSKKNYFLDTKNNYKGLVTNIFVTLNGDNSIVVTEPVFKDNELFGVLVLGLDLEKLSVASQSDFPKNYKVHVLDPKGRYAFGSSINDIGKTEAELPYLNDEQKQSNQNDLLVYQSSLVNPPYKYYLFTPPPILGSDSSYIFILLSIFVVVNAAFSILAGVVTASKKEEERTVPGSPTLSVLATQPLPVRAS